MQQNIQSTNWQSLRFKPPPPNSDIGWRVEFRCVRACCVQSLIVSNTNVPQIKAKEPHASTLLRTLMAAQQRLCACHWKAQECAHADASCVCA